MKIAYPARIVESQSLSVNKRVLISTPNLSMPLPEPTSCKPTTLIVDNKSIPNIPYELTITINSRESRVVSIEPNVLGGGTYKTINLPRVLEYILVDAGVLMRHSGGGMYNFYRDYDSRDLPTIKFSGNECPHSNNSDGPPSDAEICNTTTVIIEPAPLDNHETSLYRMLAKNGEPRIVMRSCATLYVPPS